MIFSKSSLFLLFLLGIVSIACVGVKKKSVDVKMKSDISTPGTRPATDTIHINPLGQKEYNVKVGQIVSYTFNEHASVGISAEYDLSNTSAIKYKERRKVYKYPQNQGITGGDDSNVSFVFEAIQKGNAELTLRELFRGQVQNEIKIKIIVE
jgi:hypothetical protein